MHVPWLNFVTRSFGFVARKIFKAWLFEAEFLQAWRNVYTNKNGDSPFVNIFISVRTHNKNSAPTTVYVRDLEVKLKQETDRGFERAIIRQTGFLKSDFMEMEDHYDMPPCSSVELLFCSRRFNPPGIDEYLDNSPLSIALEIGETFGNHFRLTGALILQEVVRQ
jgi:hypothetical protein